MPSTPLSLATQMVATLHAKVPLQSKNPGSQLSSIIYEAPCLHAGMLSTACNALCGKTSEFLRFPHQP